MRAIIIVSLAAKKVTGVVTAYFNSTRTGQKKKFLYAHISTKIAKLPPERESESLLQNIIS